MPDRPLWKEERLSTSPEDRERLLSQEVLTPQSARGKNTWYYVLCSLLLSVSLLALGILIGRNLPPDTKILKCEAKWSPVEDEVDSSYRSVRFNGSLLKENIFRLPASPEVDAAWESLGVNCNQIDRALAVPEGQAAKAGLRSSHVQINPKYGGGYPANVEGLHHLHCLNLVRQALYYNINYYRALGAGAFANNDLILQHHVSHCVDILRQQLMCTPNTSLLGQVWWDRRAPKAFVDFNTEHKCRNFEAIRAWAEERQLSKEVHNDFLQPPKSKEDIYEEIP
ncbi:hypothetical protein GcC1_087020 [Golovinomyces cichoracearum]|uniref:Tat pathway signal sequence n=1 Tax=Golovinomyces cichoracearum TaxID=62708 RepID=A0A420IH53_9PEZI|nr:hypothetical protein GcC1_087020 [Golovinomyces cichoracearum]